MRELSHIPEIQGMEQAGMSQDEILRIAQHPYATRFLRERLDDIDTLADPRLQESIRQAESGEGLVELSDGALDELTAEGPH